MGIPVDRDLDVLLPPGLVVEVGGRRIEIKPITIGKLPELVRAMRPLIGLDLANVDWMEVIEQHGNSAVECVEICLRGDAASPIDVANMAVPDFIELAAACVVANVDFFIQAVAPALNLAIRKLDAAVHQGQSGAGQMLSKP